VARRTSQFTRSATPLAEIGWAVVPANGKRPATPNGLNDATTDVDQISRWGRANPDYNCAALAGKDSFLALDIDGSEGRAALIDLQERHEELPLTVQSSTGGGGLHFYFKPANLPNSNGRVGAGIEVKAKRALVTVPRSPGALGD